jgi:hypothetical protein
VRTSPLTRFEAIWPLANSEIPFLALSSRKRISPARVPSRGCRFRAPIVFRPRCPFGETAVVSLKGQCRRTSADGPAGSTPRGTFTIHLFGYPGFCLGSWRTAFVQKTLYRHPGDCVLNVGCGQGYDRLQSAFSRARRRVSWNAVRSRRDIDFVCGPCFQNDSSRYGIGILFPNHFTTPRRTPQSLRVRVDSAKGSLLSFASPAKTRLKAVEVSVASNRALESALESTPQPRFTYATS